MNFSCRTPTVICKRCDDVSAMRLSRRGTSPCAPSMTPPGSISLLPIHRIVAVALASPGAQSWRRERQSSRAINGVTSIQRKDPVKSSERTRAASDGNEANHRQQCATGTRRTIQPPCDATQTESVGVTF